MERRDYPTAGDRRPAGLPAEPVYLDYNATTPVDARVAEAARPFWDQWFGNPSSDHAYGERPRQAVARAREQVAALIGAAPGEIVFTGSGSEADQLAIRGAVLAGLRAAPDATPWVITQVTEHLAVLACCEALERRHGVQATRLPVDASGLVDPQAVADALARPARSRGPAVVSVMLANNETGAIQPITQIAAAGGAEARLASLRDRLHARLAAALPGRVEVNGPPDRRLPTTLNISITGLRGHELLAAAPASPPPPGLPVTAASTRPRPC
jgi:cysteine sulfinate desulfinase/cysteine desulfurase-like protein